MIYITLDELKDQLSIHRSRTDLDERLERVGTAAERAVAQFLNAELSDYEESPAESPPALVEDVKSGILLFAEAEFDRDPQSMELILKHARDVLWPYRVNVGV